MGTYRSKEKVTAMRGDEAGAEGWVKFWTRWGRPEIVLLDEVAVITKCDGNFTMKVEEFEAEYERID